MRRLFPERRRRGTEPWRGKGLAALLVLTAAAPLPAQLVPDAHNPRWLRLRDGPAVFLVGPGDPEGFLYRGKRRPDGTRDGDQMALIERLAASGANCLYFQAVRSHGGDGGPEENPFEGSDPRRGLDEDILRQWDGWLEAMDRARIVPLFFLYDDGTRLWNTRDEVGEAERAFVQALAGRFGRIGRLLWCVAEEYEEALSPRRASAIARAIRAADPAGHPIAVHKLHGLDFSELADDPSIDVFAVQYNVPTAEEIHQGLLRAFAEARGRYNLILSEVADHGTGAAARRKSWAAAMAGAYVMVLGMDIAGTPPGDLEDCGRLARFLEASGFEDMEPRDELRLAGTEYVLASPRGGAVLYSGRAGEGLGLTSLPPGRYDLRWLDPASGVTREEHGRPVPAGRPVFSLPPGFGKEAALALRRRTGAASPAPEGPLPPQRTSAEAWPGAEWEVLSPEEAGLEPAGLEAFREALGGWGCVVRRGRLVYGWGDLARRADVASAAKPVYVHLLLEAIEEGRLRGLDVPAADFEPRLRSLNAGLGYKDRGILLRHLASQTSCYGVREEPGRAYDYSDYNMALLFDTLFLKVYGAALGDVDREVLLPRLGKPLGLQDDPTLLAFGEGDRPGRLAISARDFARFGLLYLREGRWREEQVLSRDHLALATRSPLPASLPRTSGEPAEMIPGQRSIGGGRNQTDHLGSYSLAWWTNGVDREGNRHWPDAPQGAFCALGHGGQRGLAVMPGLDLVASWNDSRADSRAKLNTALALLVRAVRD